MIVILQLTINRCLSMNFPLSLYNQLLSRNCLLRKGCSGFQSNKCQFESNRIKLEQWRHPMFAFPFSTFKTTLARATRWNLVLSKKTFFDWKKKERPSLDPFNDQTIYHLICRGDVGSPARAIANLTKKFLSQLKRWLLNFARQISYCAFRELGNNSYVQRASKILPTEERPLHNHGSSKNQVKAALQGWKVPLSRKMKKCIEIV